MEEQVLIYSISESAAPNASLLFLDQKYFYWNNEKFRFLESGDYTFLVNRTHNYVLFTRLNKIDIPTTIDVSSNKTSFKDAGRNFTVDGTESNNTRWENFVRFEILKKRPTSGNGSWQNLGAGGTT